MTGTGSPAKMKTVAAVLVLLAVAACTAYQPSPLAANAKFLTDPAHVRVARTTLPFASLASHSVDTRDGLDMTLVAMLAVTHNPDLIAARAGANVARAQSFSASLLPDPQFNLTSDFLDKAVPGGTSSFTAGLSYALNNLVTYSSVRSAARSDERQTDLNLLWQEWQVVTQSRLLFVRITFAQRRLELLQRTRSLFADRYERTAKAMSLGLMTLNDVTPNLVALQDVDKQIRDLDRLANQARHDLNLLLGFAPQTELVLRPYADQSVAVNPGRVRGSMLDLARRRPDLLALRAGYDAQDSRYYTAILGQFPSLTIGVQRSRDNSNVFTKGFGITVNLPFLNGNRGEVAVQQATRAKLNIEYQQRLNASVSEIERILSEQDINARQGRDIAAALTALQATSEKLRAAFVAHNVDALTLATLETSFLGKQVEQLDLEQAMLELRIGLETLVGGDLPDTSSNSAG